MVMNLRKLLIDDLLFLLEVRNHITTRNNLENNLEFSLDECKQWFIQTKPKWYIIEVDDTKIGYLRTNGNEIGCDIHPNFRRKGYARQAYKLYLKDKKYATLWVFDDNFAKNLYLELGFKENNEIKIIRERKYIKMIYENRD
jgi:hypothetical protein